MLSKMKSSTEGCRRCSICFEMNSSEKTTVTEDVMDFLKFLILRINCKLLQESSICETCSTKIQSACKLKTAYLENLLKTEAETERCVKCEICKNILNQNDCVSLFDSLTESNRLDLFRYLSTDLESKIPENPQTCELCHKSLLNFCTITNLITIFDLDNMMNNSVVNKNESQDSVVMNEHSQMNIYACSSGNCDENNEVEIKREAEDTSYDIKEEKNDDIECGEFQYSNEDDVKMDSDEELGMKEAYENKQGAEKKSTRNPNLNIFQCQVCLYQTEDELCYKVHMINHTNSQIKSFKCEFCEFKAQRNSVLKKHVLIHKSYDEVVMFACDHCDFQTKRKGCLKKHMLTHKMSDEVEMFSCDICEFRTKRKDTLKKHINIHKNTSEVEMFQCQLCNFQTKHNGSIKKHMIIHKKSDEIVMFTCLNCNFQTKRKDALKKHMLVHKSTDDIELFHCQLCEFKTKHNGSLKQHMLLHKDISELVMYKCEMCKYQTKHNSSLRSHLKIHNKQK